MTFSDDTKLYEDFISPNTTVFDENAIRNAVRNILLTRLGTMPGIPSFGSRLHEIPFSINDPSTRILIKRLITESLSKWEKRIVINNVDITSDSYNSVIAKIDYYFKDASLRSSVSVKLIG